MYKLYYTKYTKRLNTIYDEPRASLHNICAHVLTWFVAVARQDQNVEATFSKRKHHLFFRSLVHVV